MKDESRDKKRIFEIISKNRLFFAYAGSIVAIIAFFTPMLHFDWYNSGFHEFGALWIFGLHEWDFEPFPRVFELLSVVNADQFILTLISLVSTIVMSVFVLGTIITASNILIRKRKKKVYSSRLLLYCSIGLLVVVNSYTFAILMSQSNQPYNWFRYSPMGRMGAILFMIGSVLILMGYTVKIKPLLMLLSLFLAGTLIYYGVFNLTDYFTMIIMWETSFDLFQFNRIAVPAIIFLLCALAIVVINFLLYRRIKNIEGFKKDEK